MISLIVVIYTNLMLVLIHFDIYDVKFNTKRYISKYMINIQTKKSRNSLLIANVTNRRSGQLVGLSFQIFSAKRDSPSSCSGGAYLSDPDSWHKN